MTEEISRKDYVLDTSLFLSQHIRQDGDSVEQAVERLVDSIEEASRELGVTCYMPPSTHEELVDILEGTVSEKTIDRVNAWISVRSPSRYEVKVPGEVVSKFIEEMRERVNKGLRLSEKALRELEEMEEEPDNEYYTQSDVVISDLRDKYKEAMRKEILDSKEDLDLLLLAKELDAGVVTEDRGVLSWAEDFGLRYVKGREFPTVLDQYLDR